MSARAVTSIAGIVCALVLAACDASPPPARPSGVPVWFEERAETAGLAFEHVSGHDETPYLPEIMGGGAALFDVDGDGDLDAYLVQSGSLTDADGAGPGNRLFRNRGDGTFDDISDGSGADDRGYGMGVAAADHDNDGDIDLYVTNVGPNVLLRNDGDRFVDVTAEAGVGHPGWSTSAVFLDFDRDGDLDLFVTNYVRWSVGNERECYTPQGERDFCSPRSYDSPARDALYRNEGDGTFTDVTEALGFGSRFGNGLGVVAADFDGDGWSDVFVANDGTLDQLWVNDHGTSFEDRGLIAGCASDQEGLAKAGMGVTVGDVDEDGDLDLLVCNLMQESDSLFRNDGGWFRDVTAISGLATASRPFTRFGMGWVDFDNDGLLDLYQANGRVTLQSDRHGEDPFAEPNLLFRGLAGGRFEEVVPRGGTDPLLIGTSRAAAFGDVDGDGRVDLLVVERDGPARLLINVVQEPGNWIAFRVLDRTGRDAEGAIVQATVQGRRLRRDARAGFSYLASSDPRVHLGLGPATTAEDVTVTWPDGARRSYGTLEGGRVHDLTPADR